MHFTELHFAIGITLLSSLLWSGVIAFRKANDMDVKRRWLHLRTASWGLRGISVAMAVI